MLLSSNPIFCELVVRLEACHETFKRLRKMMLKTTILIILTVLIVGCTSDKQSQQLEKNEMQKLSDGAYLLSQVTITEKGKTTVKLRDQIKIYTKGKFMFAFDNESTGDMDVGAGNATWVDGVMIEEPLVNHDGPLSNLSFEITIKPTETGFEQILHGMKYDDGRVLDTMVEVWKRAQGDSSPFDGLWQLKSRETESSQLTQFTETKMIGGGHFVVLQSALKNGEKVRNFGFGTFALKQDGRVVETGMVGSWKNYSNHMAEVKFELIDENHMVQSFILDGRSITQNYVRM